MYTEIVGRLELSRKKNGLFVLDLYEADFHVWEKLFLDVDNALRYFVDHPEIGDTIKVNGNLYL